MTEGRHRWYRGYEKVGNSSQLVHQIGTVVRNWDLGRYIPVVRIEKKATGRFYFFVAIESTAHGVIPAEVERFCSLPFLGRPLPKPFRLDEIRTMVSGELDVQDYARRLPYRVPELYAFADPFGAAADPNEDGADSGHVLEDSQAYDRLLMWLSAVGQGSWGTFQGACRALGLDRDGRGVQRIIRTLRLLGHAETSRDGTKWSIAPTVLARVTGDDDGVTYVLCGARDPGLITALGEFGSIQIVPQHRGSGPATIALQVGDPATFLPRLQTTPLKSCVIVAEDAALRLAQLLPSLTGWIDLLDPLPTLNPYQYDCRRYDGQAFSDEGFAGRVGFYEIWPPATSATLRAESPLYKAYYDAGTGRWVRGDWYGMRFLAHSAAGGVCPVEYQGSSRRLAIPSEWRWPELYERVLVLAYGRLPTLARGHTWLTYEGIPASLLTVLADKLPLSHASEVFAHA
jgi:hypothetical protein